MLAQTTGCYFEEWFLKNEVGEVLISTKSGARHQNSYHHEYINVLGIIVDLQAPPMVRIDFFFVLI
jgi:hypothetical protein